jgi:hypothetical protein
MIQYYLKVNVMQIQEVKNRRGVADKLRLVRYAGYDVTKKQAKLEIIGSFSAYSSPSDELLNKLKDDEKQELNDFLKKKELSDVESTYRIRFRCSAPYLVDGAAGLTSGSIVATDEQAQALYAAMDKMAKALRKVGHTRAKAPAKPKLDTKTDDLFEG